MRGTGPGPAIAAASTSAVSTARRRALHSMASRPSTSGEVLSSKPSAGPDRSSRSLSLCLMAPPDGLEPPSSKAGDPLHWYAAQPAGGPTHAI
jgi:hypothetical protein